jgi:hypothetical protein
MMWVGNVPVEWRREVLMTALLDPFLWRRFGDEFDPPNFAASVVPSPPHPLDKEMNGLRRAFRHGFGFVYVIGAVSACATAASPPRVAADEQAFAAVASNAPHSADTGGEAPTARTSAPPALSVEPGSADDLPYLSPSHIGAAVRAHHADFQACQALGDLESQREDGAVTVGWAVQPNGSVNGVTLGSSTFASGGINACVLGVAKKVTFPASAAPTQVSWTVKFRGAPHAPLADATPR